MSFNCNPTKSSSPNGVNSGQSNSSTIGGRNGGDEGNQGNSSITNRTYAQAVCGAPGAPGGGGAPGAAAAVGGRAHGAAVGGGRGGDDDDDDVPGEIIIFRGACGGGGGGGAPGAAAASGDGAHGAAVGGANDCGVFELFYICMFSFVTLMADKAMWYVNQACRSDVWTTGTVDCTFSCSFDPTVDESRIIQGVIPTLWYAFSHPTKSMDMIQNFFFEKDNEGSIICWVVKNDAFASKMKTRAYKTYWYKRGLSKCPDWVEGVTTPNSIKDIINQSNMARLGTGYPKMKNPEFSAKIILYDTTITALEEVAKERKRLAEESAFDRHTVKTGLNDLTTRLLKGDFRTRPGEFIKDIMGSDNSMVSEFITNPDLREAVFKDSSLVFQLKLPKNKGDFKLVLQGGSLLVIHLRCAPHVDAFLSELMENISVYFSSGKYMYDGILDSATERVKQEARRLKQKQKPCHKHSVLAVSKPHTPKSKPQQVEAVKEVNREFKDSGTWLLAVEKAMSVGDESKRAHLLRVGRDMGCLRLWPKRVVD
jgi:hypothetical protein